MARRGLYLPLLVKHRDGGPEREELLRQRIVRNAGGHQTAGDNSSRRRAAEMMGPRQGRGRGR